MIQIRKTIFEESSKHFYFVQGKVILKSCLKNYLQNLKPDIHKYMDIVKLENLQLDSS